MIDDDGNLCGKPVAWYEKILAGVWFVTMAACAILAVVAIAVWLLLLEAS